MWTRSRTRTRTQLLTIDFFSFSRKVHQRKYSSILTFLQNGEKKFGRVRPALSKSFNLGPNFYTTTLKNTFSETSSVKTMTKLDFFEDQENFSKTILPKNVGKFRVLDPIQRRRDYFSKFFRDCSKKCRHIQQGCGLKLNCQLQNFSFSRVFIRENIQVF